MTAGPSTGYLMRLYRNTGTVATPTWTLVNEIGDVNIPNLNRGLAELKRRANEFTKNLTHIIQSIQVEFTFPHGLDATNFDAIRQNFFNGTVEEWAIMDQDIATSGAQGLRCPMVVADFPWNQPLEDVSQHEIRLAIGYMEESSTEVDPSWYTVP